MKAHRWTIGLLVAAVGLAAVAVTRAADAKVGAKAPAFTLTDVNGTSHTLADAAGKYVVLEWVNHGCPYVKKQYDSGNMQRVQRAALEKGAVWYSICSSASGKQGHMSPAEWKTTNSENGSAATAVLLDENGKVGKAYGAKTTPHMYVIDPTGRLIYKGAIDDDRDVSPEGLDGAKNFVLAALDEATAGKPVSTPTTESYGCSVKY